MKQMEGHLIAFAGLDPSIHQSGQYEGISRLSNRGNRHLRRVIFLITLCAVRSQNIFREYFLKRKAEGLPPRRLSLLRLTSCLEFFLPC